MRNVRVFAAKGSKSRRKISCEIRYKSVILPKGLIACVGVGRCGVEMRRNTAEQREAADRKCPILIACPTSFNT